MEGRGGGSGGGGGGGGEEERVLEEEEKQKTQNSFHIFILPNPIQALKSVMEILIYS